MPSLLHLLVLIYKLNELGMGGFVNLFASFPHFLNTIFGRNHDPIISSSERMSRGGIKEPSSVLIDLTMLLDNGVNVNILNNYNILTNMVEDTTKSKSIVHQRISHVPQL